MDIKIPVSYKDLDFIVHVTAMDYSPGCPGTGPTFSCGGTPPEPEEVNPTDGWVELDGDITDIIDMTQSDIIVIEQMNKDNLSLFKDMMEDDEIFDIVYDKLITYKQEEKYDEMASHYEAMEREKDNW